VTFYALVDNDSTLAIDVFISRELAEAAFADALVDEPSWASVLTIVAIDVQSITQASAVPRGELN
jgi:hypothetical protein